MGDAVEREAVVVLYYLHEMSLEETAAVLGVPLGTSRRHLKKSREAAEGSSGVATAYRSGAS
jgi:DNA-directed RNA polymerase specialized sigma24 family protein